MTNSRDRRRAIAIIREVFEKTSDEYLQMRINERVERAAVRFEFDRDAPVTHKTFNRVIADFVRYVHGQALWGRQELTAEQASDEAVTILEEGYQGPPDSGYDAAFLDALNTDLGLEYVLGQMAGYIIAAARAKHVRWVWASRLELSDRPTRCLIGEVLLERWKLFLPENLREYSPAQLAHYLPDLIKSGFSANRTVNTLLRTNIDSCNI